MDTRVFFFTIVKNLKLRVFASTLRKVKIDLLKLSLSETSLAQSQTTS